MILAPAGGTDAAVHFKNTVLNSVPLDRCAQFVTDCQITELAAIYGRNGVRVWGVTPGDGFRNRRKWDLIDPGDAVLFCGKGEVFAHAFVNYRLHNRALAIDLWGQDRKGRTWEYVYFTSQPLIHSIRYRQIARAIGFSDDFVVLGFMVLDELKSAKILHEFDLADT